MDISRESSPQATGQSLESLREQDERRRATEIEREKAERRKTETAARLAAKKAITYPRPSLKDINRKRTEALHKADPEYKERVRRAKEEFEKSLEKA